MKNLINILFVILITTTTACAQKKLASPRENASGVINNTNVSIDYGAPSVKGRVIWGSLVPYDKVWRAGANENTTISFNKDVTIEGQTVPVGKYGFFIIPTEKGDWTLILNKKNDAWGAFTYDQKDDLIRFMVTPTFVNDNEEMLVYKVENNDILISWEKARLFIPIK